MCCTRCVLLNVLEQPFWFWVLGFSLYIFSGSLDPLCLWLALCARWSPGCRVAGCCRVRLPGCRGVAGSVPGCRVPGVSRVLPGAAGCCRVLPGCEDVCPLSGAAGCCRVLPGCRVAGCCRVAGLPGCAVGALLGLCPSCRVAHVTTRLSSFREQSLS